MVKTIKKLFGDINITWKKIIIFAVLIAVYTSAMALIPATEGTSFRDIAIHFDWWILFGVLIIVNSKSPLDSALKCFVFFLISQPLVYLFQVPFSPKGFGLFSYYKYWFIWTVLTFPMGYIGYYIKKSNILSAIILLPMLLLLSITGIDYFKAMHANFPSHLLSFVFSFALILIITFNILKNNGLRILSIFLTIVISVVFVLVSKEPQGVKYTVHEDLSRLNIALHENIEVTQFSGGADGGVGIIPNEEGTYILELTGNIDAVYTFVITDNNMEYTFEYQYTNDDGMKLILKGKSEIKEASSTTEEASATTEEASATTEEA